MRRGGYLWQRKEAMDECIEENILVDFFEQHREEVVEVSIYDYDEEKVRKTLVDEAVEEIVGKAVEEAVEKAVQEAVKEAKKQARIEDSQLNKISLIIKKVKKEKTLETIASELEENVEDIKVLYDMVKEAAPEYDVDIAFRLFRLTGKRKRSWWKTETLTVLWAAFPWKAALTITAGQDRT